jgi:hypothetical protein
MGYAGDRILAAKDSPRGFKAIEVLALELAPSFAGVYA